MVFWLRDRLVTSLMPAGMLDKHISQGSKKGQRSKDI